jgi:hypothetical protein
MCPNKKIIGEGKQKRKVLKIEKGQISSTFSL